MEKLIIVDDEYKIMDTQADYLHSYDYLYYFTIEFELLIKS